jgi:hypothetical protein
MTFQSISQISADTLISIPSSQLRTAIKKIEEGKLLRKELDTTKQLVSQLKSLSNLRDSTIQLFIRKDSTSSKIIFSYSEAVKSLKQQQDLTMDWANRLEKRNLKNKLLYSVIALGLTTLLIIK